MELKSFFVLPPIQKHFYKLSHTDYIEPPANKGSDNNDIRFLYPTQGSVISLPHKIDGSRAGLVCKATHNNPSIELFWHLDDTFVGTTADVHQIQISPNPGMHRITVVDNYGNEQSVEFIIK